MFDLGTSYLQYKIKRDRRGSCSKRITFVALVYNPIYISNGQEVHEGKNCNRGRNPYTGCNAALNDLTIKNAALNDLTND